MIKARKLVELAAYVAMGPITGPLVAGAVHCYRRRQPIRAVLFLAAVAATPFVLAWLMVVIWTPLLTAK